MKRKYVVMLDENEAEALNKLGIETYEIEREWPDGVIIAKEDKYPSARSLTFSSKEEALEAIDTIGEDRIIKYLFNKIGG